jgi:hypothetical protein
MVEELTKTTATIEIDRLFRKALSCRGGGGLPEMIEFLGRFRQYSIWNAAMIRLQRPGALAVATASKWERTGRVVNADAIPIVVLQPFGPINLVYELSDTSPPLSDSRIFDPFKVEGEVGDKILFRLKKAAFEKDRISVEEVDYGTLQAGSATKLHTVRPKQNVKPKQLRMSPVASRDDKFSTNFGSDTSIGDEEMRYRIRIARRLDGSQRFVTVAHELGHIYCGHLGAEPGDPWPNRQKTLSKEQRELEAEAVAYLVGCRAGVNLPSAKYLSGYVQPGDLEMISVDAIIRAVSRIETHSGKKSQVQSSFDQKKLRIRAR